MRAGLVVAVGLVAVLAAGALSTGAGAEAVLSVPRAGEALPTHLPDGTPVFVVRTGDDDVFVVDAVNPNRPYRGLRSLVGWCAHTRAFEDAYSRFRADGSLFEGNAGGVGLTTYEVRRSADGSAVAVGARRRPYGAGLTADPDGTNTCSHPHLMAADPGTTHAGTVTTLIAFGGRPLRRCDDAEPYPSLDCPDGQVVGGPLWQDPARAWRYDGPVYTDARGVALLPGGSERFLPASGLRRVFGWVRGVTAGRDGYRLDLDEVRVFVSNRTSLEPLRFGEPVPDGWRMTDRDGDRIVSVHVPYGVLLTRDPGRLDGVLLDLVVDGDDTVHNLLWLRGRRPPTAR